MEGFEGFEVEEEGAGCELEEELLGRGRVWVQSGVEVEDGGRV